MNLITTEQTMTLKEITDLLDVRHDYAMKKVKKLSENEDFGMMFETSISVGPNQQKIKTLKLDQRQSIAVASMLNTSLLMRVIDRWQELEAKQQPQVPQTLPEALRLAADLADKVNEQAQVIEQQKPAVEYHDKVLATENGILTTEIAAELGMSAIKLNRALEAMRVQRKVSGRWVLTVGYLGQGYDIEATHVDDNGTSRHSMKWSEKGRKLIHELMEA